MADAMLIHDGGFGGLAMLAVQSDPGLVIAWHAVRPGSGAARRRAAVERQAARFGVERTVMRTFELPTARHDAAELFRMAAMLAGAAADAAAHGCPRLIWPCHVGRRVEAMDRLVEVLATVQDLAPGAVAVEVPLLECTAEQVIDLGADGGAPFDLAWFEPAETDVWRRAFDALGVPWPFESASAAAAA